MDRKRGINPTVSVGIHSLSGQPIGVMSCPRSQRMLTVSRGQLTNCVLAGTKARNLRIPGVSYLERLSFPNRLEPGQPAVIQIRRINHWGAMVLLSLGATGGIVACQLEMWNGKTGEAKPKLKVGVKTFG